MKFESDDSRIKHLGLLIVGTFLIGYLIGMFVMNQPTNPNNQDIRMAMIILLTTIVNQVFKNNKI